jgi:hypothetical protein
MGSEIIVTGLTSADPIAIVPPTISGLIVWAYFGSIFSTDNTNLAPGGTTFGNIGSGPEAIEENYIRCWYNAALHSGWNRYGDSAGEAMTIVAVGRTTRASVGTQPLCGSAELYLSPREVELANGSVPTISNYTALVADPYLTVPTTLGWRAYALTEPAAGVSGTARVMDLTGDAEATSVRNGAILIPDAGNYLAFGTVDGAAAGSVRMEIAFAAAVLGSQMSRADILADIMPAARATLALRGITGV